VSKLKSTAKRLHSLRNMIAGDIKPKAIEEAITGFPPSSRSKYLMFKLVGSAR
jgi:hypothetical protein